MRQFSDQALDLSSVSPAAVFEATHPRAEQVIAAILRTQDVALETIPQQVLLRREVEDFVGVRFQADFRVPCACVRPSSNNFARGSREVTFVSDGFSHTVHSTHAR